MSLYEWSLYLHRHKVLNEKELQKQKDFWRGLSVIWAVLMNGLFGGNKKYKPSDLIDLDGDTPKPKEVKPKENLLDWIKREYGTTLTRKNGKQ